MPDVSAVLSALDFPLEQVCSFPDCAATPMVRYRCRLCGGMEGLMCRADYARVLARRVAYRCWTCGHHGTEVLTVLRVEPLMKGAR